MSKSNKVRVFITTASIGGTMFALGAPMKLMYSVRDIWGW